MHSVKLSNGTEFVCQDGQTILEGAEDCSVFLEHSCKNGRCGVCVAGLVSGSITSVGCLDGLSEKDRKEGLILTCRSSPTSNITLDIEDLGDLGKLRCITLPCRIAALEFATDEILILTLRLPPNSSFDYLPGQYLELISGSVRRSYSIGNAPRTDGSIDLHIKRVTNGKLSSLLFLEASINDLLRLEGPKGTFCYRDAGEDTVVFLATGTGVAPIKSIIEAKLEAIESKRVMVFWGARYKNELYLEDFFRRLNVEFYPVLSREKLEGYCEGYVQDAFLSVGPDLERCAVYACGSLEMISDSRQLLYEHGLSKDRFRSDAFVSSA